MQRYEKIMTISDSLYQKNCPIIFVKGALLKDNKLNKNILQLQFKNLGANICKAVYVSIECSDIENKKIEMIEKKYIDLELKYSSAFGENIPIELSSDLSRKFQINIDKIIFKDDSIVEYSGGMCVIEAPDDLKELNDLKNQFIREVEKDNRITRCTVKPTVINGLWYCTCGALNHSTNDKCGMCKIDREKLFSFLNTDFLQEQNNEYLRQKEIEENERKLQEEKRLEELRQQEEDEKEKKKKHKKILIILVIIAIMLAALYGLAIKFVVPGIKYSSAIEKIENSDYEEAYTILEELGEFKDSKEQILAGKYKQAAEFFEQKDYVNAINIYEVISEYSDSKEKLMEVRYQYVKDLFATGDYIKVVEESNKILDYKDTLSIYQESCYICADKYLTNGMYKDAVDYYEKSAGYSDANEKCMKAMYLYVQHHLSSDNSLSKKYLEKLVYNKYKRAEELEKEMYKLKISVTVNGSQNDYTNNASSLSKYSKWYFHVNIDNGMNGEKYDLKYTLTYPDGGKKSDSFKDLQVGAGFTVWGWYENAYYGKTGTATLKVYDGSGNFLAEKSVQIY